jgi:hypothetical protein
MEKVATLSEITTEKHIRVSLIVDSRISCSVNDLNPIGDSTPATEPANLGQASRRSRSVLVMHDKNDNMQCK